MKIIKKSFILRFSCKDQPGIVASVASFLYEHGCNILEAQQFDDQLTGQFFGRIEFEGEIDSLEIKFNIVASKFGMQFQFRDKSHLMKVMLLVSNSDHCLADLLYRWKTGELPIEPVGIISNHPRESFKHLHFSTIPFHYLPVNKETKSDQENKIWELVKSSNAELTVLARYMQILSDDLASKLSGACINIHHSFLPGFKGAKPYHQAFDRGVKLIGATAHYVTGDLDEGPIIAQAVEPITHRDKPEDLVRKGRDTERRVLAKAVLEHVQGRVLLNGSKTVVFTE